MVGGLVGRLAQYFQQRHAQAAQAAQAAAASAPAPVPQSAPPVLRDPIVSGLNQQLAQEQSQPVASEADQLKQEQHAAWGNYDFERCIVIFSRLHELEPDNSDWPDKLKTSYFNRGKQYENEGNMARASQCYYAALQIDPNFTEAQQAAEQMLQKEGS